MSQTYHYQTINRAITFIRSTLIQQPKLEQIAGSVGMSPYHFQRVFTEWVGMSPKRYQEYLTLGFSKELLQKRHTLLDVTLNMGLSGTSRLHDLFIKWEAMTPGEYALNGAGVEINWGFFDSPFGQMLAMATKRGLCGIGFVGESSKTVIFDDFKSRWPNAVYIENKVILKSLIETLVIGKGTINIHLIGAPFQIKVWEALMNIPTGFVTTYSDIAKAIDNKAAVRAVGTAVGKNPISWLIPCHRVLRKNGELGGYHWGIDLKTALLARESAQFEGDDLSLI
ncbi:MAG: 6-O-methylguanine DNA methyltransferase [Rhodobacteraceae bacterium]|jgi:AraC family transcriptional regulator of adaptative response/methylated-DNA-[protein]-cysteine methyltransferase|nr:6-O-methylguanine DNA methyltransferase [Paracoccaceae bacterium]MDG1879150.1 bifunctional helix-turn-helix domain-containing protein/methylated-DNA--[protein]-cysteine S-methyltransferase [Paracoccaceae bacterium]MDG1939856.1 bifunctional helix-turn-helix domain-containing protein/methylated-DNA--[protein]-cysteine S-methyltransferase [Paracoccaceae bacterium]|tara:strand:- start:5670 stop:6515 length:846 start_codon:yes stop_codon:yes gene_type:complete